MSSCFLPEFSGITWPITFVGEGGGNDTDLINSSWICGEQRSRAGVFLSDQEGVYIFSWRQQLLEWDVLMSLFSDQPYKKAADIIHPGSQETCILHFTVKAPLGAQNKARHRLRRHPGEAWGR